MSTVTWLSAAFCIILGTPSSASVSGEDSISSSSSEHCDNDWEVKFIASGAKFRIHNECNSKQFFQLQMSSLIEYDANNNPTTNSVDSFGSIDGDWDHTDIGGEDEYEGNSVLSNIFRVDDIINPGVNFALETIFFIDDATIFNKSTAVSRYSLKWNVDLTNWPFLNVNNTLELCVNITTTNADKGRKHSSSSDDDPHDDDPHDDDSAHKDVDDSSSSDHDIHDEWNIGDFALQTLNYADCDGSGQIIVNIEDEKDVNLNERNICFSFDYCASGTIEYDPIISYVAPNADSSGLSTAVRVAIGVSCGIILLIICGGVLYCIKKKKDGQYQGLLDTEGDIGEKMEGKSYSQTPGEPKQEL